jgi:hypothetical protein
MPAGMRVICRRPGALIRSRNRGALQRSNSRCCAARRLDLSPVTATSPTPWISTRQRVLLTGWSQAEERRGVAALGVGRPVR